MVHNIIRKPLNGLFLGLNEIRGYGQGLSKTRCTFTLILRVHGDRHKR